MKFTAGDVARAVGGRLSGSDVEVDGVSIDSRTVEAGQLFVAIVGERDGHDFIAGARARDAAAVLTSRPVVGPDTAIVVADTADALLEVGRLARSRLGDCVIGVTGSVGKTTVKDLIAAIVSERFETAASLRSFNNELGVPLTLANAPIDAGVVVVELGARGRGHIALLSEVARPTIGVVTAVGMVHTELFGSIDDVALGKCELVEALPVSGTAVLNADDERVEAMRHRAVASVVTYGVDRPADVVASGVVLDRHLRPSFLLQSPWGSIELELSVRGVHQVSNALASAAASLVAGAGLEDVAAGLATAVLSPWRMDIGRAASGAMVINDAYNANPISMAAALRSLALVEAGRRIAFLGAMAELGDGAAAAHREVAAMAAMLGIRVISVAEPMYGTELAGSIEEAAEVTDLDGGDAVLVKGSRVAGLERLAELLLAR